MKTEDAILELRRMQNFNYTIADDEVFDIATDAMEKQVAKKVITAKNSVGMSYVLCPRCGSFKIVGNCCIDCRQKVCR